MNDRTLSRPEKWILTGIPVLFAVGSAFFAGVTAILAKCGIRRTDSTVATAIRTIVVLIFAWVMVFVAGSQDQIRDIDAKALLFSRCDVGVYNADDPWAPRLMQNATCRKFSYGEKAEADLRAENIHLGSEGITFDAVTAEKRVPVSVGIPGGFMVYNTLDVLGAALALGISLEKSADALSRVPHVKGRVEVVPTPGKDYTVLIDYAHSPDGLENVLTSVKGFAKGRTIALFGCGGDRDKTKRPKMGRIAADIADFVVVTSDNPRTEKPADIIADILPGLEGSKTPYVVIEDRVEAIHWALDHAQSGDVIALCGKGHETYQEINHVKHHMDEREIVADYLVGK